MKVETVRAPSLIALTAKLNEFTAKGWKIQGSPFSDPEIRAWCCMVTREKESVAPGGISLREPGRKS